MSQMTHESEPRPENGDGILNISQVHSEIFTAAFLRYHRVLYLVAYRVLFNHGDAGDAVQSFFLAASNNVPRFDCEDSFRSWLLRGLIDEALAILQKNRSRSTLGSGPVVDPLISYHIQIQSAKKLRRYQSDKSTRFSLLHELICNCADLEKSRFLTMQIPDNNDVCY
jgi:DNA-directed RNA polymerase specialized sigma24 family protein